MDWYEVTRETFIYDKARLDSLINRRISTRGIMDVTDKASTFKRVSRISKDFIGSPQSAVTVLQ